MNTKDELIRILKAYCQKNKTSNIVYENFYIFLDKYLEKHGNEAPGLFVERVNLKVLLESLFVEMQKDGSCNLQLLNNRIQIVTFLGYYFDIIEKEITKISGHGEIPFPSEETLGISPTPEIIENIDVKQGFVTALGKRYSRPAILKLIFPDIPKNVIVTSTAIQRILLECSLVKIKIYLRSQKNAIYIQHKLLPSFRQKEGILKDLIVNTVTKPDQTIQEMTAPSDNAFLFWTQLSTLLLKEYITKKDRIEDEIDLCIAAYLIGYYTVFNKSRLQREKDSELAYRTLQAAFDRSPYAYTFHEIYNLKDTKGLPIVNRIDKERLNNFFEEKTKSKDKVSLPDLIKIKISENKEFFLRKENVIKVIMERVSNISKEINNFYNNTWPLNLLNDKKLPEMEDDEKFAKDVSIKLEERDSLVLGLMSFNLLFLIREQIQLSSQELDYLNSIIDKKNKNLLPLPTILNLSREDLYHTARLKLPFWKVIPGLNILFSFINNMLFSDKKENNSKESQKKKKPISSANGREHEKNSENYSDEDKSEATKRVQKVKYKESLAVLRAHYIEDSEDSRKKLSDLATLWNPLIDEKAKINLIEDVNSLVRDYLRKLKYATKLTAPDFPKLESLAVELSKNEVLSRIRDKDSLKNYIALYMLDILDRV